VRQPPHERLDLGGAHEPRRRPPRPAPLSTRHVDVWDAIDRLAAIVESGEHEHFDAAPARVT
jgi:hypothetical protein